MSTRANRFDQILDECIDRILLEGDTVESCLARYPDLSAQLEPYLRTVVSTAHASRLMPSLQGKGRGRQRLQAELRDLEARDQATARRSRQWAWPRFGLQPQWAVALAVVLLAILIGGSSTVAASGGALPGDTLYVVKQAVEQVRLGFQLAPAKKAELHLAYAQRRAQEMAALIQQGRVAHLGAAQQGLSLHIAAASAIARSLDNDADLAALKPKLETSASQSLATLQAAVQQAPEESREVASTSYDLSSQAYGDAVEDLAVQAPGQFAAIGTGTLQLRAVDPPPPDVDKVLIQVSGIEVHRVSGDGDAWIPIATEPQTFDLLRIATVQHFLGERIVDAGTYTQVRFTVKGATVEVKGVAFPATVPSGAVKLSRPFRVAEGQTTVLLLDFDGQKSLVVTGKGEYILRPVVTVLAQEPGNVQPPSEDKQQGPKDDKDKEKEKEKGQEQEQKQKGESSGKSGDQAQPEPDDSKENREGEKETPGQQPKSVSLVGTLEALAPGRWTVDGVAVLITPDTKIEGSVALGSRLMVRGQQQPNGEVIAETIVFFASPPPQPTEPPPGPPPQVTPTPTPGAEATPTPTPTSTPESDDSEPPVVTISGLIEQLTPALWVVDGQRVLITPETTIAGIPVLGAKVTVQGVREHGNIRATAVTVEAG